MNKFKEKGQEKICHLNQNKTGVTTLVSDKIDFTTKNIARRKFSHFIVREESIGQEDITLLNI
jgi:hypothetical protein